MADGWVEYVFVSGDSCETFCSACGQLRLWAKPEKPVACGCCGSARIVIGPLLGEQLPKLREAWLIERGRYYPCGASLESESELAEPYPCGEPERYRAKDNRPRHAHLCAEHWGELSEEAQAHYAAVDLVASARELQLTDALPTVVVLGGQSEYTDEEAS